MKRKVLFITIFVIIINVSGFAGNYDSCVNIAKAVATNVAVAISDLGEAEAAANSIAEAGDSKAISNVIASISSVNDSLTGVSDTIAVAVAVSAAVVVDINLCPYLENILSMLGIELNDVAATIGVGIATNNPNDLDALKAALHSACDNLREGLSHFRQ